MNCSKVDELKHEYYSETMHLTVLDQVNCFFYFQRLVCSHVLSVFFKVAPWRALLEHSIIDIYF